LPADIFIRNLEETSPNFDVRTAKRKRYRYLIWAAEDRPLFQRHFVYHYYKKLHFAPMQAACADFVGTHDFEGFRGQSELRENTVRTIFSCAIHRRAQGDPLLVFAVEGSGFLYHMVRTMVGTILQIGTGRLEANCIPKIFASRRREDAGVCAPAQGLCLQWVRFHDLPVKTSMETEAPTGAKTTE
jgi:tRNA pseudouridine38-40 synthase